jgi:uncharacterized protein (DUF1778 family)
MPGVKNNKTKVPAELKVRVTPETKRLIEQAAFISRQSFNNFVITNLEKNAREVVERHHTTVLSDRDRDLFLALLDADDEPNEALREAAETYKRLIKK